jgi:hypothetical protein
MLQGRVTTRCNSIGNQWGKYVSRKPAYSGILLNHVSRTVKLKPAGTEECSSRPDVDLDTRSCQKGWAHFGAMLPTASESTIAAVRFTQQPRKLSIPCIVRPTSPNMPDLRASIDCLQSFAMRSRKETDAHGSDALRISTAMNIDNYCSSCGSTIACTCLYCCAQQIATFEFEQF